MHVTYLFDHSTDIRDQLGSLSDSIILAIVLVMIIIVAALGLRSGLLVGVGDPDLVPDGVHGAERHRA